MVGNRLQDMSMFLGCGTCEQTALLVQARPMIVQARTGFLCLAVSSLTVPRQQFHVRRLPGPTPAGPGWMVGAVGAGSWPTRFRRPIGCWRLSNIVRVGVGPSLSWAMVRTQRRPLVERCSGDGCRLAHGPECWSMDVVSACPQPLLLSCRMWGRPAVDLAWTQARCRRVAEGFAAVDSEAANDVSRREWLTRRRLSVRRTSDQRSASQPQTVARRATPAGAGSPPSA